MPNFLRRFDLAKNAKFTVIALTFSDTLISWILFFVQNNVVTRFEFEKNSVKKIVKHRQPCAGLVPFWVAGSSPKGISCL